MRRLLATAGILTTGGVVAALLLRGAAPEPAAASPVATADHAHAPPPPPPRAESAPERLAPPPDAVDESSGLAASHARPGWLWTCNDSGGGEALTRYDPDDPGAAQAFTLAGVRNRDWEDLASFRMGDRSFLLVADTGDNLRRRADARLLFVEEPAAGADPGVPLAVLTGLRIVFADGPRDCEAVAVDASRGVVLLGSKEIDQNGRTHGASGLYEVPLPDLGAATSGPDPVVRVERVAELPTLMPTGMDVAPDGSRLAICTYGDAMVFGCDAGGAWADVVEGEPDRVRTPPRRQGEAVAFGLDGASLYFTSEGKGQPTWRVRLD